MIKHICKAELRTRTKKLGYEKKEDCVCEHQSKVINFKKKENMQKILL